MKTYSKSYKVNGQEDINDFMLMRNLTYFKYSDLVREDFFSKPKNIVELLKVKSFSRIDFTIVHQSLIKKKDLFFTNFFTVDLKILDLDLNTSTIVIRYIFFNQQKEICAITNYSLNWNCNYVYFD
jgi:acyl-CoA thioesterase FadM